MNAKLLKIVIRMSKYAIYAMIVCQSLILVMASDLDAQRKFLEEIDVEVSDNQGSRSLLNLISEIESNTEFTFAFSKRDVKEKEVSIDGGHWSMDELLKEVSLQSKMSIKRVNETIALIPGSKAPNGPKVSENITLQTSVSGTITGEDGESLPGASVIEKGTTNGTVTDIEGKFSLRVPADATLIVSFVGYQSMEVPLNGRTQLNLQLNVDVSALAEVVVVGYGTQQKVNLTGSVSVADGKVLQNRPIANVGEGLQGMVPNLNVNIRNGDPSQAIDFNIRGFESINGGNPLILVDGVPMDLNKINPNDIESISVLKDASAAAIYGSRGAFGVVLVTTKKGKGERINVSVGSEFTLSKPIMFIDPIEDPYEYVQARGAANMRTNNDFGFDQDMIDGTLRYSQNPTLENAWGVFNGNLRFYGFNNYQEQLLIDWAPQQKYDASVSGSTERASYYASFGALNKDGWINNKEKNINFKRYNVLLKGEFSPKEWISLDSRALVTTEKSDQPHFYNWDVNINTTARVNPLNAITFPDLPYYLTPGDRADYERYIGMHFSSVNFLPYLEQGGRETWTRNDIILTQGTTITPLKGWNIRAEYSSNITFRNYQDAASKVEVIENMDLDNIIIGNGFSGTDNIVNEANYDVYQVINTYTDYTLETGSHYLKAMVGFNQEWGQYQWIRAQAYSLLNPAIPDLSATTGSELSNGSKSHVALRGVFYRVNYIFNDRYLIEANGRYDGTSRFPKEDRFGFFPSFSVGWRISNEAFMSGTSAWLDNLKLRASYGSLGNQLLVDNNNRPIYYPYIPTMSSGASVYMMNGGAFTPYVSRPGLVSPTLTWETVISKNIGLDFTMLGNRLDVSFDAYTRDTKDMLTRTEFPAELGLQGPQENAADLRTNGWELSATWKSRISSEFNYSVTLALSDNLSKITKYDNPTGALSEYYEGKVVSDFGGELWGFVTEGIFQTDQEVANAPSQADLGANWRPGDMRYADLNGDGSITRGSNTLDDPGDQTIIAYQTPRYQYGINSNFGYRSFTLNVFFQGLLKHEYWPPNGNWNAFYPYNAGHVEKYYLTDTWSEDNRDAYFAAPHISTNTKQNVVEQSRYVQNGGYIRLKNVSLAYNLPETISSKVGLSNVQVYMSGMNVFEFTKMRKPLDPEVRPTVTQEYYKQRSYSLGFRISI
ncbi:MAG: TonB-dependent receptor [Cyclobacteriaceae bacterium]|nr:TonB-dependent receptor [Cyclobacteriaceae bacterium SS2]